MSTETVSRPAERVALKATLCQHPFPVSTVLVAIKVRFRVQNLLR